jgi:hypothetical protein
MDIHIRNFDISTRNLSTNPVIISSLLYGKNNCHVGLLRMAKFTLRGLLSVVYIVFPISI